MTLDAKEIAYFIVTRGGWGRDNAESPKSKSSMKLMLEGITKGRAELIAKLDELLPSLKVYPASELDLDRPSDHRRGSYVDLIVDERELNQARKNLYDPLSRSARSL